MGPIRVLCDTYVVSTGQSSARFTRVRGAYPVPAGPTFKVYWEGFRASLGKAIGFQDVVLGGDPTFDQMFMITCDHPAAACQVWSAQAKELMLRFFGDCFVSSDERLVTLLCSGAWTDALRLEYALDLVGLLAVLLPQHWADVHRQVEHSFQELVPGAAGACRHGLPAWRLGVTAAPRVKKSVPLSQIHPSPSQFGDISPFACLPPRAKKKVCRSRAPRAAAAVSCRERSSLT